MIDVAVKRDRVEVYRDTRGEWRWRYVAQNGHVLADSGEGYSRRIDCVNAAKRVVGTRLTRRVKVLVS